MYVFVNTAGEVQALSSDRLNFRLVLRLVFGMKIQACLLSHIMFEMCHTGFKKSTTYSQKKLPHTSKAGILWDMILPKFLP